jgi:hypothetical protein
LTHSKVVKISKKQEREQERKPEKIRIEEYKESMM